MTETIGETIMETDGVMTGEATVDGERFEKQLKTGLYLFWVSWRGFRA